MKSPSLKESLIRIASVLFLVYFLWFIGWESLKYILLILGALLAIAAAASVLQWARTRFALGNLRGWMKTAASGSNGLITSDLLREIEHADLKDRAGVFPLLDEICDKYLSAEEDNGDHIRRFFAEEYARHGVLLKYSHFSALKLKSRRPPPGFSESETATILRRGLAAVSINNLQTDWRECQQALDALFRSALATGLEPAEYFEHIRSLSSDVSPHPQITDHPSMRRFLKEFQNS